MGQPGFFDLDERHQRLSENGDPLVKLATLIDFEAFRLDTSKNRPNRRSFEVIARSEAVFALSVPSRHPPQRRRTS